jgi:hypothetical protein
MSEQKEFDPKNVDYVSDDIHNMSEADLEKAVMEQTKKEKSEQNEEIESSNQDVQEESTEQVSEVESEEQVTTEESQQAEETVSDPLAETPFKSVDEAVKSYKHVQSKADRVEAENARLKAQLEKEQAEKEEYEEILTEPEIEDPEDEEPYIPTKKEFKNEIKSVMSETVEEIEEKQSQKDYDNWLVSIEREASQKIPDFATKSRRILDEVNPHVPVLKANVPNPILLANTMIDEGLVDIYRSDPGLIHQKYGGLDYARALKRVNQLPEEVNRTSKEKAVAAKRRDIEADKATVATSKPGTPPVKKAPSDMTLDELKVAVGDVGDHKEFDI